jgi:hypothetical protein
MSTITLDEPLNLAARQNTHELDRNKKDGEITFYMEADKFRSILQSAVRGGVQELFTTECFDCQGKFKIADHEGDLDGRVHAVLCCDATLFSITARGSKIRNVTIGENSGDWEPLKKGEPIYDSNRVVYDALTESDGFSASPNPAPSAAPINRKGLVLIAGGTASGKTTTLNQILTLHLRARLKGMKGAQERLPHVVAIGDPVETLFFNGMSLKEAAGILKEPRNRPIDFTPRIVGRDVETVELALQDALRETPEAVVVSELRTRRQFEAALNFAGTGHLLLATCHTGSLVETFAKLLEFHGSESSASGRAALVNRLAGIVHIRRIDGHRVPALWRPTSRGRQDFISEGLSSIIPASPPDGESANCGVLGRYWMLRQIRPADPALTTALGMDLKGE